MVGVLIVLKCCRLQMENLDKIITMIKKWPNDLRLNCTPNANLKDYMKNQVVLIEKNNQLIANIKYFKKLQVDMY
jgi:predicted transcriptional regulator